jgi:hypothetical protein
VLVLQFADPLAVGVAGRVVLEELIAPLGQPVHVPHDGHHAVAVDVRDRGLSFHQQQDRRCALGEVDVGVVARVLVVLDDGDRLGEKRNGGQGGRVDTHRAAEVLKCLDVPLGVGERAELLLIGILDEGTPYRQVVYSAGDPGEIPGPPALDRPALLDECAQQAFCGLASENCLIQRAGGLGARPDHLFELGDELF